MRCEIESFMVFAGPGEIVRMLRFDDCAETMNVLAKNGVLAMVSVTGGSRQVEIPADKINLRAIKVYCEVAAIAGAQSTAATT